MCVCVCVCVVCMCVYVCVCVCNVHVMVCVSVCAHAVYVCVFSHVFTHVSVCARHCVCIDVSDSISFQEQVVSMSQLTFHVISMFIFKHYLQCSVLPRLLTKNAGLLYALQNVVYSCNSHSHQGQVTC